MRLILLAWLSLGCVVSGVGQVIPPPEFIPYSGPVVVYPDSQVAFTVLAKDHQPDSIGSAINYEVLVAPSNVDFSTTFGRLDEKFLFFSWQTPSRLKVGTTNCFLIRVTDFGSPPLSATNAVSFVVIDPPPILSVTVSNGCPVLQFTNPLPLQPLVLQSAPSLPATNWMTLSVMYSDTAPVSFTDTNPPAAQRFYRLVPYGGGWCYGFCP